MNFTVFPTAMEIQNSHPPRMEVRHDHDQHHSKRSRKMIGKYYLTKTVGRGSTGKVKLAINTVTNEKVAVKMISRKLPSKVVKPLAKADAMERQEQEKLALIGREVRTLREASIMLLLNHPNIACVTELMLTEDYYYLCMEYVDGGQLLDYIISHGKLKEKQARNFSRQIASALDYCHRNSIVHRDLKVENILISRKGKIKIIDFGLSNLFAPSSQLKTFCGSLYFAAPEILSGKLYTGPEVDVWSLGVVMYVLVCGQVPFDDPTVSGMHMKVKEGHVVYPPYLSSDCKHLLQHMLVTNSTNRATMAEIIAHSWMNKGYDRPILSYLPKREPLRLPLDPKVVNGMNGFGFGTTEQITRELECMILSKEYQIEAKNYEALAHHPLTSPSTKTNSHHTFHFLRGKEPLECTINESECLPSVHHPMLSVYYLVKERIERESDRSPNELESKRHDNAATTTLPSGESKITGYSYTIDGKREFNNPTEYEETTIRNSIQIDEVEPNAPTDVCPIQTKTSSDNQSPKATETMFHRFRRRVSRQFDNHSSITPEKTSNPRQNIEEISPPYITIDDTHTTASNSETYRDSSSSSISKMYCNESDITNGSKLNRFMKRAKSITVKDLPSSRRNSQATDEYETPRRKSVFHPPAIDRKTRGGGSSSSKDGFLAPPQPSLAPNGREKVRRDSSSGISSQSACQADQSVRSVYLKGLFSVSNTSTKKPQAIRNEIKNILDRRANLQYRETNDRFECLITNPAVPRPEICDDFFDRSSDGDIWSKIDANSVRFDIFIVRIPWLLNKDLPNVKITDLTTFH